MNPIFQLISLILSVFQFLLLARVLMSWFPQLNYNSDPTVRTILRFIHNVTEPVLIPVRQLIPPMQGIDFAPLAVFALIYLIQSFLR